MSKVKIMSKGLAIKKPATKGLELDFLYEEKSACPHKLKLKIDRGGVPDEVIDVPAKAVISIETTNANAILHISPDELLALNLLNLNHFHAKKLNKHPSLKDVELINLVIKDASPYTETLTDPYQLYVKYGKDAPVALGKPRSFTHQIGAEFELNEGGILEINGVMTKKGKSIEPIVYEEGKNYEIIFDNDCHLSNHNDFGLYYDVLDGENMRISVDLPGQNYLIEKDGKDVSEKSMFSLEIACNVVEGGDPGSG